MLAKADKDQSRESAPGTLPCDAEHRLPELVLLIDVFTKVGLVDDVDQVARFGDTPKHHICPDQYFPFAKDAPPEGLTQIDVCAVVISGIRSSEGGHPEFVRAILRVEPKYGFDSQSRLEVLELVRKLRTLEESPQLRGQVDAYLSKKTAQMPKLTRMGTTLGIRLKAPNPTLRRAMIMTPAMSKTAMTFPRSMLVIFRSEI